MDMNTPYILKKCTDCGRWLVANSFNFYNHKGGRYGLRGQCKECREKHKKEYYENNKGYLLKKARQWYEKNEKRVKECREKNKEHMKEYMKEYRKEYRKEYSKKYYKRNREKIREYQNQYFTTPQGQVSKFNDQCMRRSKEQNQGNGITAKQWLEMMKFFNWECAYSGKYLGGAENKSIRSIDHLVPISKYGEHEIWNVIPMYRPYNSSKHNNDMLIWYKEQGFYSKERLNKIYEWQEYAKNKWGN